MQTPPKRKLGDHGNRTIQRLDEHMIRARAMATVTRDEMRYTVRLVAAAGRLTMPGRAN